MASKLIRIASYEAENQLELSLRQAFDLLESNLRPPFPLTIPNPQEYTLLNQAILYGVLIEPHFAKIHIKHLHAIVIDGYKLFSNLLVGIVNELYGKLVDSVKDQLIWVTKEMIDVSAVGIDSLLVCLLRQIVGGDFSDGNLWLCFELVSLCLSKWDCLLQEEPIVLTSALYTFLRLLADHCRVLSNPKLEMLRQLEIEFCVKMLREQFCLCLKIGRDLVRLLQDLVHIPEFKSIWKDLVLNPTEFRTSEYSDISQLYCIRTSSRYFLLRITPEMETQLRFLLSHVMLGSQKRYQTWFAKKFLLGPERESLVVDIVRFICCAHHPPNEIIQSNVIPRWAVIGWLLKCCRKNYIEANGKLALFYDWLFFNEKMDNVMNIEPAVLLMVCSLPKYIDFTHSLLEFLLLLVDNYDLDHKNIIVRGVSSAFNTLVLKGVVHSLDVLIHCDALSSSIRESLQNLLLSSQAKVPSDLLLVDLPDHSTPSLSLPDVSCLGTPTPSLKEQFTCERKDGLSTRAAVASVPALDNSVTTSTLHVVANDNEVDATERLDERLQTLEGILLSFVNQCNQRSTGNLICREDLSSKIAKEFESNGYQLFTSLGSLCDIADCDDEIGSATALIIRTFIFSQNKRVEEMLVLWARNALPVGARLLSYASRLAYEANATGCLGNAVSVDKVSESGMPLLAYHFDGYFNFLNRRKGDSSDGFLSSSEMGEKSIADLVSSAFTAYKCFLLSSRTILDKETDTIPSKLLSSDLKECSDWKRIKAKYLLSSVFCYLSDLAIGEEDIIRLLIEKLDYADLTEMQFEIGLKKFSLFGGNPKPVFHLIKNSLNWNCLEQHKFWGLVRSELSVSEVRVEKIILEFFCSSEIDANLCAIAVGGLLTLCSSCAPKPELVGAIMSLPNNLFQDFAAAALATWAVSNTSMLFDSLTVFAEKLRNKSTDSTFLNSTEIMINQSAILWLLNYFNAQGMNGSNMLSNFCPNI
ncbi:integrator complex subunit 3 homolog [Durio zibethinus]|uniref:Integrator complex subunit 3 homolog n=1 Tax=Durio zibethinus TaxID=66656 RepID=A0A6P5XRU9_DURZI|nr:integrator complex subunit 3 homolog [Durio zibethinus]XP_022730961.1 integrator complex subunit 3 homolog [Durio zibethinus]XP_022730962.1 integrator complex subunit 3 homolog [Durio zibethinus]XP_022730963.1 integrator complex subunit 3 homolog [Durio zibethinus]